MKGKKQCKQNANLKCKKCQINEKTILLLTPVCTKQTFISLDNDYIHFFTSRMAPAQFRRFFGGLLFCHGWNALKVQPLPKAEMLGSRQPSACDSCGPHLWSGALSHHASFTTATENFKEWPHPTASQALKRHTKQPWKRLNSHSHLLICYKPPRICSGHGQRSSTARCLAKSCGQNGQ